MSMVYIAGAGPLPMRLVWSRNARFGVWSLRAWWGVAPGRLGLGDLPT